MAQVFKGFVGRINEKSGNGRKGPWTLYSTKLQDANGEDSSDWLSFGFDRPSVKTGDYVKVTVDSVDGRDKVTEVKKLKNPPARTAGTSSGSVDSSVSKQSSIHYQNSRTAAIETVRLLIETDSLGLPKAGTKPGEAKRFSIVTAAIDKFTVQYYNDLETMRLLETVADAGVKTTEPDSKLPDDANGDDPDEEEEEEQDEEDEDDDDED